jgi:signal transduction histidine kinase/CheY-like chemotaxis protein
MPLGPVNIVSNREFNTEYRTQGIRLVVTALMAMAFFAVVALVGAFSVGHRQNLLLTVSDPRQGIRLIVLLLCLSLAASGVFCRRFVLRHYLAWASMVWLLLSVALTLLIVSQHLLTLAGTAGEAPHNRFGGAVLIVTLIVYITASVPSLTVFLIMAPPMAVALHYNYTFLNAQENSSQASYFLVTHLVGTLLNSYRYRREQELFLSKQKLTEALTVLAASEKREKEISAAKTRLIGSVSHDLRQPLNSLALYNNLLRTRYGGSHEPGLNSISERVHECVAAMEGNLTRLQEIAQLQSRAIAVQVQPVDLQVVLRSLVAVFEPVAQAAQVRLKMPEPESHEQIVTTHSERLFEILANLLSNAIKFAGMQSERPGWVLLVTTRVRGADGTYALKVTIRDNGIGIAPENHKRIFDEYVQINNPERQREKGYGLGLAVVRELCQSLEGHQVQLRSQLGKGACFSVFLPISAKTTTLMNDGGRLKDAFQATSAAQAHQLSRFAAPIDLAGAEVILIEDDEVLRKAITAQLQDFRVSVRAFPTSKHALAATANDTASPTCIVSDYWLPDAIDGIRTIELLREQIGESVPALLISAASDIDPERLKSCHNVEFALKPVSAETFSSYVRKHLSDKT